MDETLTDNTILGQSGPESNDSIHPKTLNQEPQYQIQFNVIPGYFYRWWGLTHFQKR